MELHFDSVSSSLLISSFCKPHLPFSSLYPSEFLMQKIAEENEIPMHLPVSSSLQYVAGLKGKAILEFFHSSIAEVMHTRKKATVLKSMLVQCSPVIP